MAEFPSLPLFTDSLLADTGHLNHEEFGAYMRILILLWRTPECRIPCADAWLMRKLVCDTNKFNELFKPLFLEFLTSDGAYYRQKRLSKEFEYVRAMRVKNRGAAKSRWDKEKRPNSGNAPTPTPIPVRDIEDKSSISVEPLENLFPQPEKKELKNGRVKKQPLTTLPDDWRPHERHYEKCRAGGHEANILADQFRNHHIARATRFANWDAAFYTWIGNASKYNGYPAAPKSFNGKRAYGDSIQDAAEVAKRIMEEKENLRAGGFL